MNLVVTRPSLNSERLLELNCLVLGDDPGRVFPVKIAASESVGTLRKLIKDENNHAFEHVDAKTLALWNVSIPVDENSMQSFSEHDFVEQGSLPPMEELSKIFTRPPAKMHVHIVVKGPSIGECL
jgi:Crinkler effector protein N-terminal domain